MSSHYLAYTFCVSVCILIFGELHVCAKASTTSVTSEVNNWTEQLSDVTILRRFLLADTAASRWVSWEQHIACLTTCVKGYEQQTVACCTTGDNRICFDLPWPLLNNSIGNCKDFCQRKDDISCHMTQSVVCGSDGRIYQNRCEFAKAACHRKGLVSRQIDLCQSRLSTSPLASPTSSITVTLKQSSATRRDITSATATFPHSSTSRSLEITSTPQSLRSSVTLSTSTAAQLLFTSTLTTTSTAFSPTIPAYCQNKGSISCGFSFKLVCGSDKKYYANLCMLALGRCDNPYLTQKDMQYCASGTL